MFQTMGFCSFRTHVSCIATLIETPAKEGFMPTVTMLTAWIDIEKPWDYPSDREIAARNAARAKRRRRRPFALIR